MVDLSEEESARQDATNAVMAMLKNAFDESLDSSGVVSEDALGRWCVATSRWLVDATLCADFQGLSQAYSMLKLSYGKALQAKSPYAKSAVSALLEVTAAAIDRAQQQQTVNNFDINSLGADIITAAAENLLLLTNLEDIFPAATDRQLLRQVHKLIEYGLACKSAGYLTLTPRGEDLAKHLSSRRAVTNQT